MVTVRPCLVYVAGLRGPEPQVWHDPMVTPEGKIAVCPQGIEITGGPHQLPDAAPWTVDGAEARVLRQQKHDQKMEKA